MGNQAERQAWNVVPPRRGEVLAITLDTTARPYDISGLAFGRAADTSNGSDAIYLTLFADGADCWFYFHSATASDLNETAAVTAGGTAAFANTYGAMIQTDTSVDVRILRNVDKFLIVKGSGAGKLRIWASSQPAV